MEPKKKWYQNTELMMGLMGIILFMAIALIWVIATYLMIVHPGP